MVTDDERREVAERLRHSWPKIADESATGRIYRFYLAIYESIYADSGRHDFIELLDRLADLVDPISDMLYVTYSRSTCGPDGRAYMVKVRHRAKGWERDFYAVDRDALLRLERHIDRIAEETEAHFASVVSVRELREIAQYIREALGVGK